MSAGVDSAILQTLTVAQGAGTFNSNWFDLSSYSAGAFYVVVTAGTGVITPTFNMSIDNGVTNLGAIPTAELATPTGQTGLGGKRFPMLGNLVQLPWVQVTSVVGTSGVAANVYFLGRH